MEKVKNPETVASHMYFMSLISLLLPENININKEKCMKLCIVHDVAEAVIGDITPHEGISEKTKFELEKKAFLKIIEDLPKETGTEIFNLWEEFENGETKEAKFAKDLDKFDMIFQAFEYEKQEKKEMPSFYENNHFKTKYVKNLEKQLLLERKKVLNY